MSIPALPYLFDDVLRTEGDLRRRYIRLHESGPSKGKPQNDRAGFVKANAVFLELLWAGAVLYEIEADQGASAKKLSPILVLRRISEFCGIDTSELLRNAREVLGLEPQRQEAVSLELILQTVRAVVEGCPIDAIERLGAAHSAQTWAHRARFAYEGLKSFCFRMDPKCQEVLRIVGRQYVAGYLSMDEASKLLELDSVDAVALLQQGGYFRPIDRIELTEDARAEVYRRIREARLSPRRTPTAEDVARDVIASERIEGIDARRWIQR